MSLAKVKTVEELAKITASSDQVGLCSGCFDLLHIGHIKHLKAAKERCSVLIVAIASDKNVQKGPDRPAFNQSLRLEAVASLECVDYVCINDSIDSLEVISQIRPDFYIKGGEYKDTSLDLNKKIILEKQATERYGGSLVFTEEETFSSTQLLNKHIFKNEKPNMQLPSFGFFIKEIEKLSTLRVLLLGDTIIDEYVYCRVAGTATKHPSLSSIFNRAEKMPGGVLAIARHISSFVKSIDVITRVSDRKNLDNFEFQKNINFIFLEEGECTNLKKRFISEGYPNSLEKVERKGYNTRLFEISFFPEAEINFNNEKRVISILENCREKYDCLLVSDFGHGLLTSGIIKIVNSSTNIYRAINSQTNSVNFGFNLINRYKNIDFVCIDELEARLPFGDKVANIEDIAKKIRKNNKFKDLIITRGHSGQLYSNNSCVETIPALAKNTIDTVGSGDAAFSISSLCMSAGLNPVEVLLASSVAGAMATQIVGNKTSIKKKEFLKCAKTFFRK